MSSNSDSPTGDLVDLVSEWTAPDGTVEERRVHGFRIVPYSTPRGNAAAYYPPETNPPWCRSITSPQSRTPPGVQGDHRPFGEGGARLMGRVTARRPVLRITPPEGQIRRPDTLAVEEPLEIRLDGRPLTVTMRTPGHDVELAHGFLLAEGIIGHRDDVLAVRYCNGVDDSGANTYNVLDVALADGVVVPDGAGARNFVTSSACGGCAGRSRWTRSVPEPDSRSRRTGPRSPSTR